MESLILHSLFYIAAHGLGLLARFVDLVFTSVCVIVPSMYMLH
jgi:hypothetical protein